LTAPAWQRDVAAKALAAGIADYLDG
jgi:hypothetical protein